MSEQFKTPLFPMCAKCKGGENGRGSLRKGIRGVEAPHRFQLCHSEEAGRPTNVRAVGTYKQFGANNGRDEAKQ